MPFVKRTSGENPSDPCPRVQWKNKEGPCWSVEATFLFGEHCHARSITNESSKGANADADVRYTLDELWMEESGP